ncbi:hypothetical protein H4R21_005862, partial [Coemansia helicoidea]
MCQGIQYTAQGLMLKEWPEKLEVFKVCMINPQMVEHLVNMGIQMVRIGNETNPRADHRKYLEEFCATLRDNSYCAVVRFGPDVPPPFPGLLVTYFRNMLVALPFVANQFTSNVLAMLRQPGVSNSASAAAPGPVAVPAQVPVATTSQLTPQQAAAGLPVSGLGAAALMRNASLGGPNATAAAHQMMSPLQAAAVQPNIA